MLPLTLLLALATASDLPETGRQYTLDLTLDPDERTLEGTVEIRWTNPSAVPIDRLPVHLYLNGYSHSASTWMVEDRGLRRGAFGEYANLRKGEDSWAWIRLDSVSQRGAGGAVQTLAIAPEDGNLNDQSLVELTLPVPVAPGETTTLDVAFRSRLSTMAPRTGVAEDFVLAGHAVPIVGLLDVSNPELPRWRAHQFHGQTEFFSAFADFDATIEVPTDWRVGGTGALTPRQAKDGRYTLSQRAVHDFSFVAVRGMDHQWVDHPRPGGGVVRVHLISPPGFGPTRDRVRQIVTRGLDYFFRELGPYPYDDLTVVIPPEAAAGSEAVEYATMFLAQGASPALQRWPLDSTRIIELVAAHELAHQYFQGMVATDEVAHAWLDEGFTDWWSTRLLHEVYGRTDALGHLGGVPIGDPMALRGLGLRDRERPLREPLRASPSYLYDRGEWGRQAYARGNLVLGTLDGVFGRQASDAMHVAWFRQTRFTHPSPEDWLTLVGEVSGQPMQALARDLISRPELPDVRVDRVDTWKREAPLGHVPDGEAFTYVHDDTRADFSGNLALPWDPKPSGGAMPVEITEGWAPGTPGHVELGVAAMSGTAAEGPWHQSRVRIEGPGWSSLPVDVRMTFEDGVVLRDTWQSGAMWREYRVLHTAPLVSAEVDPKRKIAADVWPENNRRRVEPDTSRSADWAAWTGASLQAWVSAAGWWF